MSRSLSKRGAVLFRRGLFVLLCMAFTGGSLAAWASSSVVVWDPGVELSSSGSPQQGGWKASGRSHPLAFAVSNPQGGIFGEEPLPLSFDLRTLGAVSAVKNQGQFDTCWTFASLGALESFFLLQHRMNVNFSELHLAYFTYANAGPSEPGFTKYFPDRNVLDQMGNDQKATAVLTRWRGPVAESDAPYPAPPLYVIHAPSGGEPPLARVQQAWSVPWRASEPELAPQLKELIRLCGGSTAHLYMPMEGYEGWFNEETSAYCYTGEQISNHAVLLVGWDDAYKAENFRTPPEGDGAWIAKNSWGTAFGEGGIFYVSYYDTSLWGGVAYQGEPITDHKGIYQYDPLGVLSRMGFEGSSRAEFANVFTAEEDETILAVGFYTPVGGSPYVIRGSRNLSGDPGSGTDLGVLAQGVLPWGGYSTVSLEKTFRVAKGEKFSLQVALETPGFPYPIPVEEPREGYAEGATANPGESYVRPASGDLWEDLVTTYKENGNVCLKVFSERDGAPTPLPGASSGGGCSLGGGTGLVILAGAFPLLFSGIRRK
jgi:C1A family cysteine protease